MDNTARPQRTAKAHVYGYYSGDPDHTGNLYVVVDCTLPGVLAEGGYLHGDTLARALNAVITAKRQVGMHHWQLCDNYYVTYLDADGMPLRRDRWVRVDPEGVPAESAETPQVAKVTPTQVYRQCGLLANMSHVLHV